MQLLESLVYTNDNDALLEGLVSFTAGTEKYGPKWISSVKFKGLPVNVEGVWLDGKPITSTFNQDQVGQLLAKGLMWLNKVWKKESQKALQEIFNLGNSTWECDFKSVADMEKLMYLDVCYVTIECSTGSNGSYILDNLHFTMWYNSRREHMSNEFFANHSLTIDVNFDGKGNLVKDNPNGNIHWQLEG